MNKYSTNTIQNKQTLLSEALCDIHPILRFALGLFVCAAVAFYVPLVLLVLTNSWNNVLSDWIPGAVGIAVLMLINLGGNKIGRIMLVGLVIAALLGLDLVSLTARTHALGDWKNYWQNFFFAATVFPINSYLLVKYKQVAGLG